MDDGCLEHPSPIPASDAAASSEEDLRFILDDVAARYAAALLAHVEARAYLASRGLDQAQLITGFKLGYCAGTLADSLSPAQKAELTRLGVLKASGGEHFKGCIVFPLSRRRRARGGLLRQTHQRQLRPRPSVPARAS